MGVIEFYKVIFKACFCQAFKGYSCSIDTEMRSAGMGRNTFGVDGESAIFFAYLILQVSHIALDTKPPFMEIIRVFFEQAIMASWPFSPWIHGKLASGVKPQESSSAT